MAARKTRIAIGAVGALRYISNKYWAADQFDEMVKWFQDHPAPKGAFERAACPTFTPPSEKMCPSVDIDK